MAIGVIGGFLMKSLRHVIRLVNENKQGIFTLFVLAFTIAKAWGYTAADRGYFIMAAIGLVFWVLAIFGNRYSCKEVITGTIIMFIGGLSLVSSHKLGAILPSLALVASKGVDVDKVIKNVFKIWIPVMLSRIICAVLGIVPIGVMIKDSYHNDGDITYSMGYCTANCFYTIVIVAVLLALYVYWKTVKIWWSAVIILIAVVLYLPTKSFTGTILLILCSLILYSYKLFEQFVKKRYFVSDVTNFILMLGIISPVFLTFIYIPLYGVSDRLTYLLSRLTTNRITQTYEMYKIYSISLFGQQFTGRRFYEMIDNAYAYTLLGLGACIFILYTVLYGICIYRTYKAKDTRRLFVLFIFFVYGYMEQFFINPFMNFSMLFICDILWESNEKKDVSENVI